MSRLKEACETIILLFQFQKLFLPFISFKIEH